MPQFDFSNPLLMAQVIWMALIFGGLYLLLSRWALPQVGQVLDERAARIGADLDSARIAKAESDAAAHEVEDATRRAATEGQAAIATAMAKAKSEAAEQTRIATELLNEQLEAAEQRIHAARTSAMAALRDVATETAAALVTRLTGRDADHAAVQAAVTHALPVAS